MIECNSYFIKYSNIKKNCVIATNKSLHTGNPGQFAYRLWDNTTYKGFLCFTNWEGDLRIPIAEFKIKMNTITKIINNDN